MSAKSALIAEYEKAVLELCFVIEGLSESQLINVVDSETKDPDCRSIQTILSHILQSGYTYIVEIKKYQGMGAIYEDKIQFRTAAEYINALKKMVAASSQFLVEMNDLNLEEFDCSKKMKVRWGQKYDVEQLLEHAIVHVLRHRRQIETFKLLLS